MRSFRKKKKMSTKSKLSLSFIFQSIKLAVFPIISFIICFIISSTFYLSISPSPYVYSSPHHTITVDGDLSEWSDDELRVPDENDSVWNPGTGLNEIKNIFVTWDDSSLYIGIEGKITNNGLILFMDSGKKSGFNDLRQINTWNRKVVFEGWAPDFFYGAWDGADGNFYKISSLRTADDISWRCRMKNSKTSSRPGWEIKIPFDLIYSMGNSVPENTSIRLCATIVTGDVSSDSYGNYGYIGGDTAPDNEFTGFNEATLNNFLTVSLDQNSDGLPDNTFAGATLNLSGVKITPVRFAPKIHSNVVISFDVSKAATVSVGIYDLNGKLIKSLQQTASSTDFQKFYSWDAKNSNDENVASGVYIANIKAETSTESRRVNKAIVVIR